MSHRSGIRLRGATAIVTGASAGIGLHVARRLARAGANLVLAARHAERLAAAAEALCGEGVQALAVPCDVGHAEDRQRLVAQTMAEFGRIDVLINNAGIEAFAPFETVSAEQITRTVEVNLAAALHLARQVVPHMLAAGRGQIVNMSSTAGKHGPAYGAVYGATKAGLIAFTQALRAEYRGRGVSASVICPGFTDEGGIYETMKARTGRGSPPLVGATTADRVAAAVVRAIERDRPEIMVNSPPLRPVMALAAAAPALGGALIRATTIRFLKRVAQKNVEQHAAPDGTVEGQPVDGAPDASGRTSASSARRSSPKSVEPREPAG
jgi:short-subunit dehydrogenase